MLLAAVLLFDNAVIAVFLLFLLVILYIKIIVDKIKKIIVRVIIVLINYFFFKLNFDYRLIEIGLINIAVKKIIC